MIIKTPFQLKGFYTITMNGEMSVLLMSKKKRAYKTQRNFV